MKYKRTSIFTIARLILNKYLESREEFRALKIQLLWRYLLILSGVKLSKGTVVAAGSVVTKSTEPYSIVGGNPAKLIRKRFSEEDIKILMTVDLSSVLLMQNSEWCFDPVDENLLNHINNF